LTEGLPVILLEAFAAGVPVVASAVGGIPEVVEEGRSGHLVPPGDAEALARRIVAMFGEGIDRRAMGAAGRERVRREFSFEQQAQQYLELIDELARGERVRAAGLRPGGDASLAENFGIPSGSLAAGPQPGGSLTNVGAR
jgi:glycogen synthase